MAVYQAKTGEWFDSDETTSGPGRQISGPLPPGVRPGRPGAPAATPPVAALPPAVPPAAPPAPAPMGPGWEEPSGVPNQTVRQLFEGTYGADRGRQAWERQRAPGPGDNVASELVARRYAAETGTDIDTARTVMFYARQANPGTDARAYWESAYGMARAGQLDEPLQGPVPWGRTSRPITTTTTVVPTIAAVTGVTAAAAKPEESESDRLLAQIRRRSAILGLTPQAGRQRGERALAAIFQAEPAVRQLLATAEDLDTSDWRGATTRWLAGRDPTAYAVGAGLIPKPPPRTVQEQVDERALTILRGHGLMSPELERRLNQQLEAVYQADIAGTEPPPFQAPPGGGRFMPPIPSTQLWQQFGLPEQQGVANLFQAMGITPQQLADQIRRLAPPPGESNLATLAFRRRL